MNSLLQITMTPFFSQNSSKITKFNTPILPRRDSCEKRNVPCFQIFALRKNVWKKRQSDSLKYLKV